MLCGIDRRRLQSRAAAAISRRVGLNAVFVSCMDTVSPSAIVVLTIQGHLRLRQSTPGLRTTGRARGRVEAAAGALTFATAARGPGHKGPGHTKIIKDKFKFQIEVYMAKRLADIVTRGSTAPLRLRNPALPRRTVVKLPVGTPAARASQNFPPPTLL